MYLPLQLRIRRARYHARKWRPQRAVFDMTCTDIREESILQLLGPNVVVDHSQGLIVTEVGFITMALFPTDARYSEQLLIVPGVDDRNQYGYLVLRAGSVPYHSLANSIRLAGIEAQCAWDRSAKLVQRFGSVAQLKQAAASAPWHLQSRMEDATDAGLCQWGVDSFLRRFCLRQVSRFIGLPQFFVKRAGGYGCRVTAATLARHEHQSYGTSSVAKEQVK